MKFDLNHSPYSSTRYPVVANKGMVCTGSSLAAAAGLRVMQQGGNAIDAAIATAAALTVVEPTANGIGADAFALVWFKDELFGLNSSGCAPAGISIEAVNQKHGVIERMPTHGWTPVTVPGAPKGWAALSQRFGKLSLAQALQPAIDYARNGFPVSPPLARMWKKAYDRYQKLDDQAMLAQWYQTFTFAGECPKPGDVITLPHHADTLESIAKTQAASFYEGALADKIVAQSIAEGGFLRKEDLMKHGVQWVQPIAINYRGYDVWEIPPNGQGIVALMALNILKEFEFSTRDVFSYHRQFEAMKMAFCDGMHYVSDPDFMTLDYHRLIDPYLGKSRSQEIELIAKEYDVSELAKSGTVYLCAADGESNMVSFIQSNYMGFGSGIVVDGTGISLQNRGHDFSLDPKHHNALAPGKRTYHTIIPGFITRNNKAVGPFGVMGGYMQPQGHVQVVMNMIDYHLNPQMALDAPRWQWLRKKEFVVETSFDPDILDQLKTMGHDISIEAEPSVFGRGQVIVRLDNGTLVGGTESRTDGSIASW